MRVSRTQLLLASLAAGFCLVALLPAILDRPVYQLAFSADGWAPSPDYFQWHPPATAGFPRSILQSPETRFWYNYSPGTGSTNGRLETMPFVLEKADLYLPTFGFPNHKEVGIYLESLGDGHRYPISPGAAHLEWQATANQFPLSLVHTSVRLVAYSNATDSIGIGTPYYRINDSLPGLAFSQVFGAALFSTGYVLLLLFPAFFLVSRFTKVNTVEAWIAAFVLSAVFSLVLFYGCYFFPVMARAVARVWLLSGLVMVAASLRPGVAKVWRPGYSCLLLAALLTLFQACFVFSFRTVSPLYAVNYLFYPASWSTDNQIPIYVAQFMADGTPLTELPISPWKISDRTPLLSCLLFPAATLLRHFPHQVSFGAERVILQMCGFGFQNLWVLPAWVLLRRFRLRENERIVALLLLAATPFIFYNSVYVWPKLLSAAFCLIQYLYLADALSGRGWSSRRFFQIALSGLAAGLAIMSHGAAALAVVGIYLVALFQSPWRQWVCLPFSGAFSALVIAPWVIWTRALTPTANPLPRFLLTGEFGFTGPAKGSVWQSTLHMYWVMPFSDWLRSKLVALQTLAGWDSSIAQMALAPFREPFTGFAGIRGYQFFFLLPSLGLLLIPLASLALSSRYKEGPPNRLLVRGLALAAAATFALQFFIMMAPHVLHHYPYFLPLTLHLLAVIAIMTRPSRVLRVIASANYLLFIVCWIVLILARTPVRSPGGIAVALILLAVATVVVGKWALANNTDNELAKPAAGPAPSISFLRRHFSVIALLLVALLGCAALLWRNSFFDTPTYASDEYAYLAIGKFYYQQEELFRNDPSLQQLSNVLYLPLVHAALALMPDGYGALKVLNVLLYTLAGFALALLLRRLTDTKVACLFLALYFILPWSGYTASIQPEVMAYFCCLAIALFAITAAVRESLLFCGCAGFFAATAFYIKPNAVGVGLGTLLFFVFAFGRGPTWTQRLRSRFSATSTFIGSTYAGLVIWPVVVGQPWRWVPQLVSGHYANQLAVATGGTWQMIVRVSEYCAGHLAVLLVLFPTGIAGVIDLCWRRSPPPPEAESQQSLTGLALARWFVLAVPASIVAVAYYSAKSDAGDPLGIRLHGRYLGFMLPLLLLFSLTFLYRTVSPFRSSAAAQRVRLRWAALLLFCGLILWLTFTEPHFRIYPWDSPELSAFYSSANTYWHDPAMSSWRLPMLLAAGALVFLLAIGRWWLSYAAVACLALWMLAGNRNNTAFQADTKRSLGILTTDARALKQAGVTRGPGVVVGADRFGPVSYALFGLASKPIVLSKPEGGEIAPDEIPPGTQWVLCVGEFTPQFSYSSVQKRGGLNLYLLTPQKLP
jgi:hypothetical protein